MPWIEHDRYSKPVGIGGFVLDDTSMRQLCKTDKRYVKLDYRTVRLNDKYGRLLRYYFHQRDAMNEERERTIHSKIAHEINFAKQKAILSKAESD